MTMLKYAGNKCGVKICKINIIDGGNAKEMEAAFRNGTGQYIHQQGPAPQQLEADGVGYVLAALGPMAGTCAFSSLAAMPTWLESDDGQAFCRAYARTRKYMKSTPAAEIASAEKPCSQKLMKQYWLSAYMLISKWGVGPLKWRSLIQGITLC